MALTRSNVGYIVKEKYSLDNRLRLRPKLRELLENDDYEERRKGLLVAKGLVEAAREIKINVPLVVRLAGTNFKEGKEILENSGLEIISASDLGDAAKKIVEVIK